MLPSSVRRVVATAPQSHHLIASLSSSAPRAAASTALGRGHQRRCSSSSKPSSPDNDGPPTLAPGQQSVPTSSRSEAKAAGSERRKRKTKDEKDSAASARRLPSVPSTQHLSQEALALSTFFSMHRPISVTHSIPKTVTEDAFAAIFASRTRANKASDVISTLSRTVDDLEGPMAEMTISTKQDADTAGDNIHKIDVKHPDGTESSVYVQLNAMAGQFLPFRPPPTPEPKTPAEIEAAEAEEEAAAPATNAAGVEEASAEAVAEETPHHRVYRAMFTIEETTDGDGQMRVVAHSPKILGEGEGEGLQQQQPPPPRSFLERMALRQLKFDDAQAQRREANAMLAISVMRQRKLKMKKKKYKKLMKRTRNERRRQGRL